MSFITLAEYKAAVDPPGTSDTTDDATIQLALDAASAALEEMAGRSFTYQADTAKYFRALYSAHLDVADLLSVTKIEVDVNANLKYERELLDGEWQLEPFSGSRYDRITIAPLSTQSFWPGYMVKVTGDWGYVDNIGTDQTPEYKAPVLARQACLILAQRLVRRKDAPFGILTGELGNVARLSTSDPDVSMLMAPLSRRAHLALIS
jgi:hypothetical protein